MNYQCQYGHNLSKQCPIYVYLSRSDLENFSFAKQEIIISFTVFKAESIPTDVYLDIYVTGQVNVHIYKICDYI